jgi:chromosome segregation ATPase
MALNVEQEIRELKARLDKHDTALAQLTGQFEFISGQLREVQRYMLTKLDEHDKRFDQVDAQLGEIKADVAGLREDLPGIVTEAVRSGMRPG